MTTLELILLAELIITWIALARCENRRMALAWSLGWIVLIPLVGSITIRFYIKKYFERAVQ